MTSRRRILSALPLAALATSGGRGIARTAPPPRPSRIQAVAFDLFTMFDPRSVSAVAESIVPGRGKALVESWRSRQFEYSWLRAAAGSYRDFRAVTEESLVYAARTQSLSLTVDARGRLLRAHEELELWPDSRAALEAMKRLGLGLAPLTNYAPSMVENLVHRAGLGSLFQELISTDRVRTYKPDPRAYALGVSAFESPNGDPATQIVPAPTDQHSPGMSVAEQAADLTGLPSF